MKKSALSTKNKKRTYNSIQSVPSTRHQVCMYVCMYVCKYVYCCNALKPETSNDVYTKTLKYYYERTRISDVISTVPESMDPFRDRPSLKPTTDRDVTSQNNETRTGDCFVRPITKKSRKNSTENKQREKLDSSSSCLLYTSPSPRDRQKSRMPSSA